MRAKIQRVSRAGPLLHWSTSKLRQARQKPHFFKGPMTSAITELTKTEPVVKHRISQDWPLLDWNSVFWRKRTVFVWEEHSFESQMHGTTRASRRSQHSRRPPQTIQEEAGKVSKKENNPTTMKLVSYPKSQSPAVSERLLCLGWYVVLQFFFFFTKCRLKTCRCVQRPIAVWSSVIDEGKRRAAHTL